MDGEAVRGERRRLLIGALLIRGRFELEQVVGFKVRAAEERSRRERGGALYAVRELPDVAGPAPTQQPLCGLRVEALDSAPRVMLKEQLFGERGDVFGALAQGREAQLDDVQAVVEVRAKASA